MSLFWLTSYQWVKSSMLKMFWLVLIGVFSFTAIESWFLTSLNVALFSSLASWNAAMNVWKNDGFTWPKRLRVGLVSMIRLSSCQNQIFLWIQYTKSVGKDTCCLQLDLFKVPYSSAWNFMLVRRVWSRIRRKTKRKCSVKLWSLPNNHQIHQGSQCFLNISKRNLRPWSNFGLLIWSSILHKIQKP